MTETQSTRSTNWKWWVCGALMLATFMNYMDRQALAVTLPELKELYNLAERRNGLLEGCFGFAFAFGSIFFGILADRIGPRRLYPVVLIGWSIATFGTAFAGDPRFTGWLEQEGDEEGAGPFRWILLCRTVLGVFEAGHWPCALITARQILTAKDRPLGNGLLQSGAAFGAILVPLYVEIVQRFGAGWQFAFLSVGVLGMLWVPLWMYLVRPGDLEGPPPAAAEPTGEVSWTIFFRRIITLGVIVSCLTVSWQFLRAWLPLFLQDFHGYSREGTRITTAGYFIATDVGCLLVGLLVWWLVKTGFRVEVSRRIAFFIYAGFTALAALVPFVPPGPVMIAMLLIAGAGILGLHPLYYAFSQELPTRHMGVLSGALAAFGWIVSSVFQILIGAEIERTHSYQTGLVIVGLAPTLAMIVLFTVGRLQPVKAR